MRYAILLIMLFLCFTSYVKAQVHATDKVVSVKYIETPLSFILKDIQKRYRVNFSYANNLVSLSKKVTVDLHNKPLKQVLDLIFAKTEISYQVIGSQIVLKKSVIPSKIQGRSASSISGPAMASDKSVEEILRDSAVEKTMQLTEAVPEKSEVIAVAEVQVLQDSVINASSMKYNRISASGQEALDMEYRHARKELKARYEEIRDSLEHLDEGREKNIKANFNNILTKMKKEIARISDSLQSHKERKSIAKKQSYDSTGYIYQPIQVSFLYPLSTNGRESGKTVNNVSLNVISGYAAGLEGVEIGTVLNVDEYIRGSQFAGLANIVTKDVTGAQFAGLLNVNGGLTNAAQFAGFANINGDSIRGMQASGFANIVKGNVRGTQLAGFSNISTHSVTGTQSAGFMNVVADSARAVQFAGFLNVVSADLKGFQAAGFMNIVSGRLNGTQVSGFLNTAGKVRGTQIGIINVADSITDGVQLGLLSFSRRGGYKRFEISGAEAFYANVAFKMGCKRFYNIFALAAQPFRKDFSWGPGYGIGTEVDLGKKAVFNLDLLCYQVNQNRFWSKHWNLLYQLKMTFGICVKGNMYLFGGPVGNMLVTDSDATEGSLTGAVFAPWTSINETNKPTSIKFWPGFNVGLRF